MGIVSYLMLILLVAPGSELQLKTSNPVKIVAVWTLKLYKRCISPGQGEQICNYSPSCSQFTKEAIEKYGLFWGILMGGDRLLRCNSFSPGYEGRFYFGRQAGRIYDPVRDHYLLKYHHHILEADSGGLGSGPP